MFYNEDEVRAIVARAKAIPALRPYAIYLHQWLEIVNSHTDGWAHWRGGHKAADKLVTLLDAPTKGHLGNLTGQQPFLNRALTPIKSAATRHKLPKPTLLSYGELAGADDYDRELQGERMLARLDLL